MSNTFAATTTITITLMITFVYTRLFIYASDFVIEVPLCK